MIKCIFWRLKLKASIYFDNINLKQKVYLYLIPILISIIYFMNASYEIKNTSVNNVKYKKQRTQLELIEYFEKIIKQNKLILNSIIFDTNINLKISGNINSLVKFIDITYTEYKILSYDIKLQNKKLYLYIKYDVKQNIYIKKNNELKYNLRNPFKKVKNKQEKLSLAIIGEYVLINHKWYQKGDIYKNKKIINIYKNKIELKDKNEIYIMRIFDEK